MFRLKRMHRLTKYIFVPRLYSPLSMSTLCVEDAFRLFTCPVVLGGGEAEEGLSQERGVEGHVRRQVEADLEAPEPERHAPQHGDEQLRDRDDGQTPGGSPQHGEEQDHLAHGQDHGARGGGCGSPRSSFSF